MFLIVVVVVLQQQQQHRFRAHWYESPSILLKKIHHYAFFSVLFAVALFFIGCVVITRNRTNDYIPHKGKWGKIGEATHMYNTTHTQKTNNKLNNRKRVEYMKTTENPRCNRKRAPFYRKSIAFLVSRYFFSIDFLIHERCWSRSLGFGHSNARNFESVNWRYGFGWFIWVFIAFCLDVRYTAISTITFCEQYEMNLQRWRFLETTQVIRLALVARLCDWFYSVYYSTTAKSIEKWLN